MHRLPLLLVTGLAAATLIADAPASARPNDSLKVQPDTFIDPAGALGDPVDRNAASAQWVNKSGTTSTATAFGDPGDFGLVLAKNVETTVVAAALGLVLGQEGQVVTPSTTFGYSYRNDGWCGAGAPRFNVQVSDGSDEATYAAGCANLATTESPVNADWTAKTWTPSNFSFLNGDPAVPLVGSEIVSIVIVFDEGIEVGPGEAILDDIRVDELVVGGPRTVR